MACGWRGKDEVIDLYAVLSLKNDATHEQIRRAYWKLSKRYHPDMPDGSAEKFTKIKQAHDVLTDDAMKEHYDLTGEILPNAIEGAVDAQVFNYVSALMKDVLNQTHSHKTQSLTDGMGRLLIKQRAQLVEQINATELPIKNLQDIRGRVKMKTAGAENMLAKLLDSDIANIQKQRAAMEANLVIMDRVKEFIDQYEYQVDGGMETPGHHPFLRFSSFA